MTTTDDLKTKGYAFVDALVDALAPAAPPDTGTGDPGQGDAPANPAGDPPADTAPPANDPPADVPPANDPPANDPPADVPPANDPPANDPPAQDPPPVTVSGADPAKMVVEVAFADGSSLTFDGAIGKDLGSFVDPQFGINQRCVRVDVAGSALSVFLRPEVDKDRNEVVFELGRLWGAPNAAAAHLGAYTATIKYDGAVIGVQSAPEHWWLSRWRWQSARRPIVAKVADLIAAKAVSNYAPVDIVLMAPPIDTTKFAYAGPMDGGGITFVEGGTGERPEIGPQNELTGKYLVTGDDDALRAMMDWAEASGSIPLHFRDENTGAPLSLIDHPTAYAYYLKQTGTAEWIRSSNAIRDSAGKTTCPWAFDSGHAPCLGWVPWLLTHDPYHLEEIQFKTVQDLIWTAYDRGSANWAKVMSPTQTRSYAWAMREAFQLASVHCPEDVPSWLLPRSYAASVVADNLKYFSDMWMNSGFASSERFHNATQLGLTAPWQHDFLTFELGCAVELGHEEWRDAYEWMLANTLARTSGKSGWERQCCSPYHITYGPSFPTTQDRAFSTDAKGQKTPTITDDKMFADWATAWAAFKADPTNGAPAQFTDTTSFQMPGNTAYLMYTRGILAQAVGLGIEDAKEPFAFVDNMMRIRKGMYYKWSIVPPT